MQAKIIQKSLTIIHSENNSQTIVRILITPGNPILKYQFLSKKKAAHRRDSFPGSKGTYFIA